LFVLAAGGISQDSPHQIRGNGDISVNAARDLCGDASTNGGNLPFQIADSSLIGVFLDDRLDRIFFEFALLRPQSMLLDLPWNKVALGDVEFFNLRIPRNGDRL